MGNIKDIYDILKDLIGQARKLKNQEVIDLAMDLQSLYFDFKEENENLKGENRVLKSEIERLKQAVVIEESIEYSTRGFFVIKGESPRIPYCSACWKRDKKTIPLSQTGHGWWKYACSTCKADIVVMNDKNGKELNDDSPRDGGKA